MIGALFVAILEASKHGQPRTLEILKQGVDVWNEWRWRGLLGVQASLRDADLAGTSLDGAHLRAVDFGGAHLSKVNLCDADLRGADLSGADLRGADLRMADARGANFSRADLQKSSLVSVLFEQVDLSEANLFEADLGGADLYRANLTGAALRQANFGGATAWYTIFGSVDLSAVKGLDAVEHAAPSTVGIDTIYLSKGNIPEVFLRGAGVPEDFIVYMRSLAANPIEFYSCFISYSSKDEEFARRLHADLQQANVRCWFAPEDLKIGDKFRTHIDESIRLYDKLMVILTENSIASAWVEEEVEAALEKERRLSGQKPTVGKAPTVATLFPIRLDDAVMQTDQAWAASLRRTRQIGDFRNWKDHDAFKKAFERLLRDLKNSG